MAALSEGLYSLGSPGAGARDFFAPRRIRMAHFKYDVEHTHHRKLVSKHQPMKKSLEFVRCVPSITIAELGNIRKL